MLAGMGQVKDSGAYVAIARVQGTLHWRTGSASQRNPRQRGAAAHGAGHERAFRRR